MKKITIALMCMLLTAGAAMAQKRFTFGPKIGVDYTHFWGKDAAHGGQLNYQAGVFMEYRFTNRFSIAPEVVFAAQGGKYDYNDFQDIHNPMLGPIDVNLTDNINYINIPVMFKFYVAPSLSIDLGPQLGINVYSKYTFESRDKALDYKKTYDQKDRTKTIDVGVGLGLTYNIAKDVFVQGRYTMGVTDVFEDGWDKAKNGNAQIAIGYRF
jgi:hypothetical protein